MLIRRRLCVWDPGEGCASSRPHLVLRWPGIWYASLRSFRQQSAEVAGGPRHLREARWYSGGARLSALRAGVRSNPQLRPQKCLRKQRRGRGKRISHRRHNSSLFRGGVYVRRRKRRQGRVGLATFSEPTQVRCLEVPHKVKSVDSRAGRRASYDTELKSACTARCYRACALGPSLCRSLLLMRRRVNILVEG